MKEGDSKKSLIKVIVGILLVLLIITVGFGMFNFLKENGPEASKEVAKKEIPVVKTMTAESETIQLFVKTQGSVEPSRRTQAASEVMGRVIEVSPSFTAGGVFSQNEVMLEVDGADYLSVLANAESMLADARLALTQEEARADQSARDWKKLGRGEPSDLVLRKPQIKSAEARILSAEASVAKAKRDLERTKLRAPYDCRVEETYTDLGSYISPGMRLADLYSSDSYEVRVPVTLEETGYLKSTDVVDTEVKITARIGNSELAWKGKVIRSEGQVDRKTMTVYLVVEIIPNDSAYPLPPAGLFIDAEIEGRLLDDVLEIPRSAVRVDNTLLTLTTENKLEIVPVETVRTLSATVIVSNSLKNGTKIIISPMETPVNGMELQEQEEQVVEES